MIDEKSLVYIIYLKLVTGIIIVHPTSDKFFDSIYHTAPYNNALNYNKIKCYINHELRETANIP